MRFLILITILFILNGNCFSQNEQYPIDYISTEILGKGIKYGSISFERQVCCNIAIGCGLGYNSFEIFDEKKVVNDVLINTQINKIDLFIPLYSHLQFGNMHHKLMINYVVNIFTKFKSEKYIIQENKLNLELKPFVGCGYEYQLNRLKYRVQIYFNIEEYEILESFKPWFGASVAIPLKV